jgi:hypothetical protein
MLDVANRPCHEASRLMASRRCKSGWRLAHQSRLQRRRLGRVLRTAPSTFRWINSASGATASENLIVCASSQTPCPHREAGLPCQGAVACLEALPAARWPESAPEATRRCLSPTSATDQILTSIRGIVQWPSCRLAASKTRATGWHPCPHACVGAVPAVHEGDGRPLLA